MKVKVTIKTKSILEHDYNRASRDCERGNWTHRIVLDPNDKEVDVCTLYGNGTPLSIWDRRAFTVYTVPDGTADVTSLVEELESEDMQDSLQAIVRGYSEEWDGSNLKGQLTEEAQDHLDGIKEQLTDRCSNLPMFWDPGDWYASLATRDVATLAWAVDRESILGSEIDIALGEGAYLSRADLESYLSQVQSETCGRCYESTDYCGCDDDAE